MCRCVYVCVWMIPLVCAMTPAPSWHRTVSPQQSLLGLMVSIDENLRNLGAARWDASLEQIDDRLEALETKIRRLDAMFQDRMDKIERQLNSRDLKADISEEKLSHKIREVMDSNYDRYSRRLSFTEERLDLLFKKLETNIVEGSLNRVEKQQEDLQSEMIEIVATLEELKIHSSQSEEKINSTHKAMQQHFQTFLVESPSREQLQKISGSLEHIGNKLNNSVGMWGSQNDGLVGCTSKDLMDTIAIESHKISNKMNNMYNDIWRRLITLETQIKELVKHSNTTQKDLLDQFRTALITERKDYIGDSQENFLEVALDAIERKVQKKLSEMSRKLDDKFDTISATQNLVMDSCFEGGGICQGFESRVSQVLEKIYEELSRKIEMFFNGTKDTDILLVETMELMKSQHNQLIRTVSHTTNMVVTLTKETSDANKQLQLNIVNIAERTEANLQEIQDEIQEMNLNGKVGSESISAEDENKQFNSINITEIRLPTMNLTISKPKEEEATQSNGILKITSDNLLYDNATAEIDSTTVEQYDSKSKSILDDTTQELMVLLNPNLTTSQIHRLLLFLNNSINLKNIEAVIQNTEAEVRIDNANETHTNSLQNDNNKKLNTMTELLEIIKLAASLNKNSETFNEQTTENVQINTINNVSKIVSSIESTLDQPVDPILNHIQLLLLTIKIQKGINISKIIDDYDTKSSQGTQMNYLKTLCYGDKDLTHGKTLNLIKKDRLLKVKSVIKTRKIYEDIENICDLLTNRLQLVSSENN